MLNYWSLVSSVWRDSRKLRGWGHLREVGCRRTTFESYLTLSLFLSMSLLLFLSTMRMSNFETK